MNTEIEIKSIDQKNEENEKTNTQKEEKEKERDLSYCTLFFFQNNIFLFIENNNKIRFNFMFQQIIRDWLSSKKRRSS